MYRQSTLGGLPIIRQDKTRQYTYHILKEERALPQVMCIENFVKFGHVVFEICERDRHTDIHRDTKIAKLSTPPGGEVTTGRYQNVSLFNCEMIPMQRITSSAFFYITVVYTQTER